MPGDGELDAEGQVIQELQQREALALILGCGLELLFELLPELAEQRFLLLAGLQPHHQVQAWLQLLVQHRGHDAHVDVAVPDFEEPLFVDCIVALGADPLEPCGAAASASHAEVEDWDEVLEAVLRDGAGHEDEAALELLQCLVVAGAVHQTMGFVGEHGAEARP